MKLYFYLVILAGMYLRLPTLSIKEWVNVEWGEAKWMCDWCTEASRNTTMNRVGSPHLHPTQRVGTDSPS